MRCVMIKITFILSFFVLVMNQLNAQKPVLDHIALHVYDLRVSTRFYQQIMLLDTIPEPFHDGKHTWFTIGGKAQLHLISGAPANVVKAKNSHLCFRVPSIDEFIKRLTASGIQYEDWPGKPNSVTTRNDGVKQVYLRDPDGWWIEVNDAR